MLHFRRSVPLRDPAARPEPAGERGAAPRPGAPSAPGRLGRLLAALPRLVRWPNLAIMLLSLVLVRAGLLLPGWPWRAALLAPGFWGLVGAALLVAAAGYVINDYYDVKIDAVNHPPERLVVGRLLRRRHAMLLHLALSGAGVLAAAALAPLLGLVTLGAAALLWGYSARFKRVALAGNVSIATLTAALVLLPELQLQTGRPAVWGYALAAFLLTAVREIVKDVEDMRGDAQHGCRTLPLVWGVVRTKWVAGVFLASLALLVAGAVLQLGREANWPLALWLLAGVLAPLAVLAWRLVRADRRRHFRELSRWCKWIMLAGVLSMGVA